MVPTALPVLRRALILSVALHLVGGLVGYLARPERLVAEPELIDIEVAPIAPKAEALPAETARPPEEDMAGSADVPDLASAIPTPPPTPEETYAVDAGVDAPPDVLPDAPPDARVDAKPDAPPDALLDELDPTTMATLDAGVDAPEDAASDGEDAALVNIDGGVADASVVLVDALDDATGDAAVVATGSGSGEADAGSGSGDGSAGNQGSGSIAMEAGSGSGKAGQTTEPAVDGEPTTCGTAANLLTYFPSGHVVTALIRFDRLRGTEWAAQTERLLKPMPDYKTLFGGGDARIVDKVETLAISTPRPREVTATTLVARTVIARGPLRTLLSNGAVAWSTVKGGLLGVRSGKQFPGDRRVFLAPFKGWFLLAPANDLGGLTAQVAGDPDTIEATGKLPTWLGGIRKIEEETCLEARGPALVVTLQLGGQKIDLQGNDFGTGIATITLPDRVSLAMELHKQGWLVRGNMSFASEKASIAFIKAADAAKVLVGDSSMIRLGLGKPLARVVDNLTFARTGARVSYATSISIKDARSIIALLAHELDAYFGGKP